MNRTVSIVDGNLLVTIVNDKCVKARVVTIETELESSRRAVRASLHKIGVLGSRVVKTCNSTGKRAMPKPRSSDIKEQLA